MKFSGGCLCGAIRYDAAGEALAQGACHCRDCQYVSGGGPAYTIILPRSAFTLRKGQLKVHRAKTGSGMYVREFCVECGTHVLGFNEATPDFIAIRAGTMDDPGMFKLMGHIWVDSAPRWHPIDKKLPKWPRNPQ